MNSGEGSNQTTNNSQTNNTYLLHFQRQLRNQLIFITITTIVKITNSITSTHIFSVNRAVWIGGVGEMGQRGEGVLGRKKEKVKMFNVD